MTDKELKQIKTAAKLIGRLGGIKSRDKGTDYAALGKKGAAKLKEIGFDYKELSKKGLEARRQKKERQP